MKIPNSIPVACPHCGYINIINVPHNKDWYSNYHILICGKGVGAGCGTPFVADIELVPKVVTYVLYELNAPDRPEELTNGKEDVTATGWDYNN